MICYIPQIKTEKEIFERFPGDLFELFGTAIYLFIPTKPKFHTETNIKLHYYKTMSHVQYRAVQDQRT